MIKNIIFDIGGVLVKFIPEKAFMEIGLYGEDLQKVMDATVLGKWWSELDKGIIPEEQVIENMKSEALEYSKYIDEFFNSIEYRNMLVESFDYTLEWLEKFKNAGYNVYLLSNYPKEYFEIHKNSSLSFVDKVDGMVVSAYEKVIKPEYEIYNILLERYSLNADECIFVDDRIDNIEAANQLGIHGIVFENYKQACEKIEDIIEKCDEKNCQINR